MLIELSLLVSFKKYYLDICPYQYIVWKYFLPFHEFPFHVLMVLFERLFFFYFDEAHFIYIFFNRLYFWSYS